MIWRDLTYFEMEQVSKSTPVVLPIGAVEQHGKHLPLMTDALIAEFFCDALHQEMPDDVLILPSISVCCSAHHMDFCGSLTVSHTTLFNYMMDILDSVAKHGFTNIIIFNAHGGNQAISQTVLESFGIKQPQCNVVLATWWRLVIDELHKITETGPLGVGHACEFETSILQYIGEGLVRKNHIEDGTVKVPFEWAQTDLIRSSKALLHRSMKGWTDTGVYGTPSKANLEKGRTIYECVMKEYMAIVSDLKSYKD